MIYGIFGLPRSGKTTYLCKIANKCIRKNIPVYTNFECKGAFVLDFDTLGKVNYHDCVLLIDEISLLCDSRDWKSFNKDLVYFFTHHGHYKVDIYYCSQWLTDCDIKIRRLTQELYYIESGHFGFSRISPIVRDIRTTDNGDIVDSYKFGRSHHFRRKKYYKMFDSYVRKELPDVKTILWDDIMVR